MGAAKPHEGCHRLQPTPNDGLRFTPRVLHGGKQRDIAKKATESTRTLCRVKKSTLPKHLMCRESPLCIDIDSERCDDILPILWLGLYRFQAPGLQSFLHLGLLLCQEGCIPPPGFLPKDLFV